MTRLKFGTLSAIAFVFQIPLATFGAAQEISVDGIFHVREQRSANDIGIGIGDRVSFGAVSVVPNGGDGTTGVAEQDGRSIPLVWADDPLAPNYFSNATKDTTLNGSWTLTFMNPSYPDKVVTTPSTYDTPPPFVENVTISGSGTEPTFEWTIPGGFTPDVVTVLIRDKSLGMGAIHGETLSPTATSFTTPAILDTGGSLDPNNSDCYVFEVRLVELRDAAGSSALSNTLGRSRSFVNFCASIDPFPAGGVYIPSTTQDGVLTFNIDVTALDPILLDPVVAIGYLFEIGSGDPNFAFVTLPEVGDNVFQVMYDDGSPKTETVVSGDEFWFPSLGVSQFTVTGIEAEAALDPANPLAFMASVGFVSNGKFTGSMTPLTTSTGPTSVRIDVMPDSSANPINTKKRGVIPVAVFGSGDADLSSLTGLSAIFGPADAPEAHDLNDTNTFLGHLSDIDGDGYLDLSLHFDTQESGFATDDTAACLRLMSDQGEFGGCDSISVLK